MSHTSDYVMPATADLKASMDGSNASHSIACAKDGSRYSLVVRPAGKHPVNQGLCQPAVLTVATDPSGRSGVILVAKPGLDLRRMTG